MADHRHKRDTNARRTPRAVLVAGPLAVLATASAVTLGVLASNPAAPVLFAQSDAADISQPIARQPIARQPVSRSDSRLSAKAERTDIERVATATAIRKADTRLWTSTALNLWADSYEGAAQRGEIEARKQVLITGRKADDRVEVVVDGESRWVTAGYLVADKPPKEPPAPTAAAGLSMAPCPDPGVESGLTSSAVYVYRSVCHAFPQITSYGGWDAHGEHSSGKAIDIMTSDVALGNAIAEFLKTHASELNLYDILWRQQIWTPVRASEGWRTFPSRGSATADHYDHVHVSTN